ncbi:internal virion protein D [Vibrio phage vB_VpaP_G1]|uniref:Internal virion protein D n=1 Tax=Vibrio phage vB_VpaP_G1 TaxID=2862773 RepID=A0AAE7WUQ8_9CAUD|nr:transglycosylase [Vibrio phage vB_VpaP_G1]QYW05823.1 internal virion protein D [Vibrio phage vB_VpaP_G1]
MAFKADLSKQTQYDELLTEAEQAQGLPSGLLKLVMMIENRNNPQNRVSPKGASGIMQIMPSNFESLGITDPNDPKQSIYGAAKLMSQLNKQYDGNVGAMLAHYNGGNRAGAQYVAGQRMNPETTQYLEYAQPYLSMDKPSNYGKSIMQGMDEQALDKPMPSDLGVEQEDATDELYTGLDARLEQQLAHEAEIADWSLSEAIKYGYSATLTEALTHATTREVDPEWVIGEQQFSAVKSEFPNGLNEAQTQRVYNSRSQADFEYNLGKLTDERNLMERVGQQTGWGKAAATTAIIGGGLLDPVALPLSTFGAVGKVIKGAGVASRVGRSAADAAIVTAAISPVVQYADKGTVSGAEVFQQMGTAAVFGAGVSTLLNMGSVGKAFADETNAATNARIQGTPEYVMSPKGEEIATPINFAEAATTTTGPAGEIIGVGPTEVRRAAGAWDESVSNEMQKVQQRRGSWYNNKYRDKFMGWADSEGVRLARSKSKVARFVQAMWSGNAAGIGKQEARNAAVLKEQQLETMQFKYIPELKAHFEAYLDPQGKVDYMSGGAQKQQADFSRAVQLERYKRRVYRRENGSDEGYHTDAPGPIKSAADTLDNLYGEVKDLHIRHKTEHSETLKDEDPVGYIEQRPDYNMLNRADPEKRKAFLDMVKDDYRAEASAKLAKMKEEKSQWIEEAYKRADNNMEAPWVNDFLKNPEAYFDAHLSKLSGKIHNEMNRRASHWFENALRDPETRYQNSEASLLTLAREMAEEWFTGREVDATIVKQFQEALTRKWADTGRRELNMLNTRKVNGQDLYLLDMFQHDVFGSTNNAMADTAGRVAMAKVGWKKEQDIADTLDAMRHDGATPEEVAAAKHISDLILNRAKGLDNSPLVQATSNMVHATMMGKLPISLLADMPTIIGNLGVGGMVEALGKTAKYALDGSLFVKDGRPTKFGNDLDTYLKGLMGHDHLLWLPQQLNADGMAMEAGGSVLRRSAAASRFTNTIAGTNWVNRSIGSSMTRTTTKRLHKYLRTGKGISELRLEDVGLNAAAMKRIKENFDLHSTKDEFGLDKWDELAREDFISAAHRFQNQNRVDKGYAGEVPKWTRDNLMGYLFSKFRVIGIRAQEKVLVRNMSIMDSNAVAMMTSGIAFATFLALARIHLDAATSRDGRKVLEERLTPAGITDTALKLSTVTGLAAEGMTVYNLLSGNGMYGSTDTPLTGIISNASKAVSTTGKAVSGEGSLESAIDANFRLLPGANSYLMMGIKNAQ